MIWYVEDDSSIREMVLYTLSSMGLEAKGFENASEFFMALQSETPDLVMLDVMLPDTDGISILRQIKSDNATADLPVIMATARDAEIEMIRALDLGADDYLAKPFSMMEMVARIKAVLRRSRRDSLQSVAASKADSSYADSPLVIDEPAHKIIHNGAELDLTLKEYEILSLLLKNQGRAFSREQILKLVWGDSHHSDSRTVDVHIRALRFKLGDDCDYIKTVRGVGYRLDL